jgi:hypothetical protein
MATIKSYSDLQQSKKLVEILPLESADMFLALDGLVPVMSKYIDDGLVTADETAIPCWSLAALLGVLPEIQGFRPIITLYYNYITYPHISDLYTKADNLVDACYKLILKLHELKLL